MKKKWLALILPVSILFLLSGCTHTVANAGSSSTAVGVSENTESSIGTVEKKTEPARSKDDGSASPEAVVKAYLSAFKNSDLEGMLDAFGVETYVEHAGTKAYSDILKADIPAPDPGSPADGFLKKLAVTYKKGEISDDILRQYLLLSHLDVNNGKVILFSDNAEAAKFLKQLSKQIKTADFSSMKLIGHLPQTIIADGLGTKYYRKLLNLEAEKYGADNVKSVLPIIELNGDKYSFVFETAKYGSDWLILPLAGPVSSAVGLEPEAAGSEQLDEEDEEVLNQILDPIKNQSDIPLAAPKPPAPPCEGAGFDTPNEAAKAYLESLKEYDIDQMISTFAVESYVDGYDFLANLERDMGYRLMSVLFNLPVVNEFSREINIQSWKKEVAGDIAAQYSSLFTVYGLHDDAGELNLASIKVLGSIPAKTLLERYPSATAESLMKQWAKLSGAQQVDSSILVFELNGSKYCLFTDAIKYNGRWYNWKLGGFMSGCLGYSYSLMGIVPADSISNLDLNASMLPIE